jgi:hypothetical protein
MFLAKTSRHQFWISECLRAVQSSLEFSFLSGEDFPTSTVTNNCNEANPMTKTLIPNRGLLLGFIPILGWSKGTPEWLVTGMVGHCVYLIMFEGVHLPPDALFQ